MKLYLSSFRLGNRPDDLRDMVAGRTLGFIPNALDHLAEAERAKQNDLAQAEVRELGLDVVRLDLRDYFRQPGALADQLQGLGGVWVRGGNVFTLRQAMRRSGFDALVPDRVEPDFVYAGYSAGVCVLAPRLDGLHLVDDPSASPYENSEVVWDGLGVLDYLVLPHYQSNHPESEAVGQAVEYCRIHGIACRPLRDGEVVVEETADPSSRSR